MTIKTALYALVMLAVATIARADLNAALAAYEKQDFTGAFEQFQQLAKLGNAEAQESLAVMYVNGQGTKRDNVMGYGWASLALEQESEREAAKGIVAQLEPHLTDTARTRVTELRSQHGHDALQASILPVLNSTPKPATCLIKRPVNPDDFVPRSAAAGRVLIETPVMPDGHARNPRVLHASPKDVYDEAARRVALATLYRATLENGVSTRCTVRFFVKFGGSGDTSQEIREKFPATKARALKGDPEGQFLYGLSLLLAPSLNTTSEPVNPWFLKGAQGGVATAQFMIGIDIYNGWGFQRDEGKGLFWLDQAASRGQVNAQVALANYLLRPGTAAAEHARALDLLNEAVTAGNVDARYHLAALLAAGPEAEQRDPQRALTLLGEIMREVDTDPASFEIRAAAQAMLGNFTEAQKDEKKAVALAKRRGWDLKPLEERLARYASNQSWAGALMVY
jgi:uncharacterized protein